MFVFSVQLGCNDSFWKSVRIHANYSFFYILSFLLPNQVRHLENNVGLPFLQKYFHSPNIQFYFFLPVFTIRNKHMEIIYIFKKVSKIPIRYYIFPYKKFMKSFLWILMTGIYLTVYRFGVYFLLVHESFIIFHSLFSPCSFFMANGKLRAQLCINAIDCLRLFYY